MLRQIILTCIYILSVIIGFAQEPVKMVKVAGGTFQMGSNNAEFPEEKIHEVTVGSFHISQFEISVDNYTVFCKENNLMEPSEKNGFTAGHISWNYAVVFCNWLSEKEGIEKAYTIEKDNKLTVTKIECNFKSTGYRLPTEAEWEYAARGGNRSKEYNYSGSNNPDGVAWFKDNFKGEMHPQGEKYPNELGIYDMTGNYEELCWDTYDKNYYSSSPKENPTGPALGPNKVVRGGSFKSTMKELEVFRRGSISKDDKSVNVSFRVVRTLNE